MRGRTLRRWWSLLCVATVVTAAVAIVDHATVAAAGTTYYVSSAGCSDANAGTDPNAPWCTLTKASGLRQPGDSILLRAGSVFVGQTLTVSGSGTQPQPIVVAAYGTGPRPSLMMDPSEGARAARADKGLVVLQNPSFVTVRGLELSYAGAGVLAQYRSTFPGTPTGNQGLSFTDLYVHHIAGISLGLPNAGGATGPLSATCANALDLWQSGAIAVTGAFDVVVPNDSFFVRGVTVRDVRGHNNLNVVNIDTCDAKVGHPQQVGPTQPHLVRDVTVDNVWAYDGDGAGYSSQCNEGMRFAGVTGLRVLNSKMNRLAACHVVGGTTAVILVSVSDATFVNNIISDVPITDSHDQAGFDHELYVARSHLYNNLIARNAGAATQYLGFRCGVGDYNNDHEVIGNSFYGNGPTLRVSSFCADNSFTARVERNLFGDSTLLEQVPPTFVLTDNRNVAPGSVPHHSADEFAAVQGFDNWRYQSNASYPNGPWVDAPAFVDGRHVTGAWQTTNGGAITRFEQIPGGPSCSSCGTARVWTAPESGVVAIRSRALKSKEGGGQVTAVIARNGTNVAQATIAASDLTGQELNADVVVEAGDTLQFIVAGAGATDDWTSWSPAIAYTYRNSFGNGDVEQPRLQPGGATYQPGNAGAVTFSPLQGGLAGAGIVSNGSGFGNAPAPSGTQAAFVQIRGWLEHPLTGLRPGASYQIEFDAAQRPGNSQTIDVLVDGASVGTVQPTGPTYAGYRSNPFSVGAGAHTLRLAGLATVDHTAFVDRIRVVEVPGHTIELENNLFAQPEVGRGSFVIPSSVPGWTFNALLSGTAGGYGVPQPPRGSQVAILQAQQWIEANVDVASPGPYAVSFSAAQRAGSAQTIAVIVDGQQIATTSPVGTAFSLATSRSVDLSAGTHTIRLAGLATTDQSAFLNDVRLVPAEPLAVPNGGFEAPAFGNGAYGYGAGASGTQWQFQALLLGGGTGVAANGSPFGSPTAPEGRQVAFVQRDGVLTSAPGWLPTGGIYLITVDAVQRFYPNRVNQQRVRVEIDGVPIGYLEPTVASSWQTSSFVASVAPGAGGRLSFVGVRAGGDDTMFIDNIRVARLNLAAAP